MAGEFLRKTLLIPTWIKRTPDCTSVLSRGVASVFIVENTSNDTSVPFTHMKSVRSSLCTLFPYLSPEYIFLDAAFKCTFPLCEKYFNRHDNLLQHLKVHRQANSLSDQSPPLLKGSSQEESHNELTLSATTQRKGGNQLSHSQAEEEEDDELASPASPPARPRTIYDAYPPRYGSHPTTSSSSVPQTVYGHFDQSEKVDNVMDDVVMHGDMSSNGAMNILTNVAVSRLRMEVSSLRTELPRSPVDMRTMVGTMQMNPC